MTIVHVIPFMWSGAGRVVIRLCEAQRRAGHDVHLATSVASRGLSDWQPHRRAASRLGVHHHGSELIDRERLSAEPRAFLRENRRAGARQSNQACGNCQQG